MWGLGELPVKNMIHLLEAKGIRVFSLSIDTAQLDAFSMWHADTPFVFLNTMKLCEHIASALSVHVEEIDQLVFGLALTSIASASPKLSSTVRRPGLRVVQGGNTEPEA